jgi:dihydroxyacid dehydratase/phosphogluconate dehydratase
MPRKLNAEELRSYRWFGRDNMPGFSHRSRMKQIGYRKEDFTGKPVIAIVNTWSEINPCNIHLRDRAEFVKRGVWQAGGFPVEIPALSISETFVKPSPMLYRRALGRVRQNHSRAPHGRNQYEHSGHLFTGRTHAARQLEW